MNKIVENIWKTILKMKELLMNLTTSWWKSISYRDQSIDFQGRSIDWLSVAGPSVMKKLWPFLNNCLFFSSYHIYYFVIVWKLFRVDPCWADVHFWYSLRASESFLLLSECNKGSIGETRAHAFHIFRLLGLNQFKQFRFWSYIEYCFYPIIKFC